MKFPKFRNSSPADSGSDVKSTKQIRGNATQTSAWKEKNSLTESVRSAGDKGKLGGLPNRDT